MQVYKPILNTLRLSIKDIQELERRGRAKPILNTLRLPQEHEEELLQPKLY
jgi:hypothetical protein